jgi:hypothetical protein
MKTERRHELQENELANWLGEKVGAFRPFGKTILGVLVLAAVAMLIGNYLRGRSVRMREAGWSAYFEAMSGANPEAFEEVAKVFPDTSAAGWSMQRAADLHLDESLRQMFQNREVAKQEIDAARELYEQVLATSRDPMLQQRATYGLAKSLESQGDFAEAQKQYELLASRWSDSQFAELARQRLHQIQQPATQQWYNWFAEQTPVSSPLTDPGMFEDLPNLPEGPDLEMPAAGQFFGPGSNASPLPDAGLAAPPDEPNLEGDLPFATETPSDGPLTLDLDDEGALPGEPAERLELELPDESDADPPADSSSDLGIPALDQDPPQESESDLDLDLNLPDHKPPSP